MIISLCEIHIHSHQAICYILQKLQYKFPMLLSFPAYQWMLPSFAIESTSRALSILFSSFALHQQASMFACAA